VTRQGGRTRALLSWGCARAAAGGAGGPGCLSDALHCRSACAAARSGPWAPRARACPRLLPTRQRPPPCCLSLARAATMKMQPADGMLASIKCDDPRHLPRQGQRAVRRWTGFWRESLDHLCCQFGNSICPCFFTHAQFTILAVAVFCHMPCRLRVALGLWLVGGHWPACSRGFQQDAAAEVFRLKAGKAGSTTASSRPGEGLRSTQCGRCAAVALNSIAISSGRASAQVFTP